MWLMFDVSCCGSFQKLSVKIPPSFKTRNLQTQKSSSTGRMTPNMDFDLSKVKLSESAK